MKYYTKLKLYLIKDAKKRSNILVKYNIFKHVGKNFFFQPRIIPDEPKLISFGDNVVIASNVTFVTHDVIDKVLNNLNDNDNIKFNYNCAPISVGNNVFIGCNTTILPNVKIGNNVIIAAGAVVNKDVKDGTIVGGNPAKVIGSFDEYAKQRKLVNDTLLYPSDEPCINYIWEKFDKEKNDKTKEA